MHSVNRKTLPIVGLLLLLLLLLLSGKIVTTQVEQPTCSLTDFACCSDSHCQFYGDCCHRTEASNSEVLHCHSLVQPSQDFDVVRHYWMVAQCPSSSSQWDKNQCFHLLSMRQGLLTVDSLPVWGATGRLYRNGHCLRCHGDRPVEWLSQMEIRCQPGCNQSVAGLEAGFNPEGLLLPKCCYVHHFLSNQDSPRRLRQCALIRTCPEATEAALSSECQFGPANFTRLLTSAPCYARNQACANCHLNMTFHCPTEPVRAPPKQFGDPVDLVFNFRRDYFARLANKTESNATKEVLNTMEKWLLNTQASLLAASDAGLLCVLATYASFATLRNRAGLLLISHSVSLLLVNTVCLLWLVWPQSADGATVDWPLLPPLIVFCFNSTFVWAALFGVDLLRTLRASLRPASSRSPQYARFALIGWGAPAMLAVAVAIALRFGRQLSSLEWRLIQACLVFAPWLLTLLFNACILVLLWYRLVRLAQQTSRALGPESGASVTASGSAGVADLSRLAGATCRVSILLGLCWLPFCLAVLTGLRQNSPLNAVATAVRNLHGLLLSFAFIGSRRVRRQMSDRATSLGSALSRRLRRPTTGKQQRRQKRDSDEQDQGDAVDGAANRRRSYLTVEDNKAGAISISTTRNSEELF